MYYHLSSLNKPIPTSAGLNPISFTNASETCGGRKSIASNSDAKDGLWPSSKYIDRLKENDWLKENDSSNWMGSRVYWENEQKYMVVAEVFFMIGSVTLSGQAVKLCQWQKELGIMNSMLYKTARHLAFFFIIFFM